MYINNADFSNIPIAWNLTIAEVDNALACLARGEFSQPIKPYLRFKDKSNRIIAMPAYVGGSIDMAGIKWIASFPKNIDCGLSRASSITVLNDTDTGTPVAVFNTSMVSIIRTASVSGYLLQKYNSFRKQKRYKIGIIGFGPIGQHHLKMCQAILKDKIEAVYLFDNRTITIEDDNAIIICDSWQEAYKNSDIFIACTSSLDRYIDIPTQSPKLVMDVSLRDFREEALDSFSKPFILDDWDEVNRENTDIEYYSKINKLCKEGCITLCDIQKQGLNKYFSEKDTLFFAPMGMGIFDIAIAKYFFNLCMDNGIGISLE